MNSPAGGGVRSEPREQSVPTVAGSTVADAGDLAYPTVWGLTPRQLHDRFWASRGIQVVRPGDDSSITAEATGYLLIDADGLALFEPPESTGFTLAYVHTLAGTDGSRERVVTDTAGKFARFERVYDRPRGRSSRVAMTPSAHLATAWQAGESWRALRRLAPRPGRRTIDRPGALFDGRRPWDVAAFARELLRWWPDPSNAVGRARRGGAGDVWLDRDAAVHPAARLVGPIWVGRGRAADAATMVVGPAVLWDDPTCRPAPEPFRWPVAPLVAQAKRIVSWPPAPHRHRYLIAKRAFDVAFALVAIAVTLPFYPLILLAIALEDGLPLFFAHRRETLQGREFPCLKFRSMRRDAEAMKATLHRRNRADGPQFFVEDDPRLTRVGRFLRRFRVDEWPQFFNVLTGQMSLVGPRPSPYEENQFCPTWRELRLSVRPGITGLWQVSRTRAPGADFQEWIRYDIEYVERASLWLDLRILARTCLAVFRR